MRSKITWNFPRAALVALLVSMTLWGVAKAAADAQLPRKTYCFVKYMEAAQRGDTNVSFVEQVVYSLFYATAGHRPKPTSIGVRPS
ncbi:MAG: hypothetical protein IT167_26230 [Bryobacterales bacterium]|nr:hypothetical protein [Bryobacterales bacterium]